MDARGCRAGRHTRQRRGHAPALDGRAVQVRAAQGSGAEDAVGVDRHSVAFSSTAKTFDAMVDARSLGLVKDGVEPKWPPITAMGYIEERVAATYSA